MYIKRARTPSISFKPSCAAGGLTLIEVLVALTVIAVGLLGIAGLQALALNNTGIARSRSLAALQASSLASAMGANPAYWRGAALSSFTVVGGTLGNPTLNGLATDCTFGPCTQIGMAAYDLKQWGRWLVSTLPQGNGQVSCGGSPVYCTIQVSWNEKNMQLNQVGAGYATSATSTYLMYTQP